MIRCRMVRTEGTLDLPVRLLGFQRPRGRGPKSLRGICNLLAQCPHFAEGELRDEETPGFGAVAGKSPAPDWESRGLGSDTHSPQWNLEQPHLPRFPPLNKEWRRGGVRSSGLLARTSRVVFRADLVTSCGAHAVCLSL